MRWLAAGAALCWLASTSGVAAQEIAPSTPEPAQSKPPPPATTSQPLDKVSQRPLLMDWAPRRWLADRGIALTGHFIAETAANDRGYRSAGWNYIQHTDLGAVVDLAKLGVGDGTVRVLFSDRQGDALQAERTGAYVQNQAYYGQGKNFRIDEISYERLFFDKRLSLKGGFYSMGNDFAGLPYVCNFNNNGHCGHPLGLLYGSGWVDSPTGQWGGRAKWSDRSGWYVEAGIYDVTPLRKSQAHGLDLGFPGTTGFIVPLEIGFVHGKTASDYPGTYKIGIYYDSSDSPILGDPARRAPGRSGLYVEAAQQIWKARPGSVQGISVFGVATLNDARTGLFRTSFEAGASWRGPFRGRGDDVFSIGWVRLNINPRLRALQRQQGVAEQTDEQLIEVNYAVQMGRSILVRPGVQYVIRPGGYASRPDTAVFTMHVELTL